MVFRLFGIVKHKGIKIANGIDGKFETNNEKTILLLKRKGFEEIKPKKKVTKSKKA